jgi:ABC-2 type transport system permease protein
VERTAMNVIYVLWLRQIKRYLRSRAQIVGSLAQPALYLLVLGFGFGAVFQQAGQGSYLQFIAPGIIAMGVLFTSIFSGIGLLWDRQFGFLKETLVAPVPRLQIMAGHTLGGATIAIIQGTLVLIVCMLVGFRPASWAAVPLALMFMALTAVVFAALGTAIGSTLKDMQGFQLIMNFLIMPIFFLSGALFPLANLPTALTIATRLDPLAYGVDGLRGAFIGVSQMGFLVDVSVLGALAALFLVLGAWAFSKIQV